MEEEKIVRIREKDYNHLIDVAKGLKDYINSNDKNKNNYLAVTYDFPTVYFLKKSKISLKLKKYLPYLIYYKDIFDGKDIIYKGFMHISFIQRVIRRLRIIYRKMLSRVGVYI